MDRELVCCKKIGVPFPGKRKSSAHALRERGVKQKKNSACFEKSSLTLSAAHRYIILIDERVIKLLWGILEMTER